MLKRTLACVLLDLWFVALAGMGLCVGVAEGAPVSVSVSASRGTVAACDRALFGAFDVRYASPVDLSPRDILQIDRGGHPVGEAIVIRCDGTTVVVLPRGSVELQTGDSARFLRHSAPILETRLPAFNDEATRSAPSSPAGSFASVARDGQSDAEGGSGSESPASSYAYPYAYGTYGYPYAYGYGYPGYANGSAYGYANGSAYGFNASGVPGSASYNGAITWQRYSVPGYGWPAPSVNLPAAGSSVPSSGGWHGTPAGGHWR